MGEGDDDTACALVLGFGPFGEVVDNPSSKLAEALDGQQAAGLRIVGRTMPVSYRRCLETTATAIATHRPKMVLGVGVAVRRSQPMLERWGRAQVAASPLDVDGRRADWRAHPHHRRPARLPLAAMAAASGLALSDDCGTYVCNGWLYAVLGMLPTGVSAGFLHIPSAGVPPMVVLRALAAATPSTVQNDRLKE